MLFGFAEFPIFKQLCLMQFCPVQNKTQRPPGYFSFHQFQRPDIDDRLLLTILGMEVRWRMFIPEHLDHDPEKLADGWHIVFPRWLFPQPFSCPIILSLSAADSNQKNVYFHFSDPPLDQAALCKAHCLIARNNKVIQYAYIQ